jgi:hypothetical protein
MIMQQTGMIYGVAARDYSKGDQIFADYQSLNPLKMAEIYGFVIDEVAFVHSPSLSKAFEAKEETDVHECLQAQLYGAGPAGGEPVTVSAALPIQYGSANGGDVLAQKHTYVPGFPGATILACVSVLLQDNDPTTIAAMVAKHLAIDAALYAQKAASASCQRPDGNFPTIRAANRITANLLEAARKVAAAGAAGTIAYTSDIDDGSILRREV